MSVDVLRHDEYIVVDFLECVHGADAGMGQPSRGLSLASKPFPLRWIPSQRRQKRFQGDRSFQTGDGGQIDTPHSAASQLTYHLIRAKDGTRLKARVLFKQFGDSIRDRRSEKGASSGVMLEKGERFGSNI